MELGEFTKKAWEDHAEHMQAVADRLGEGLALATEMAQLPALAGLIVHVRGEHLGQWEEGIADLRALTEHAVFDGETEAGRSIYRSLAILHRCQGDTAAFESVLKRGRSLGDQPIESDHARVYAIIASTLTGQDRIEEAMAALETALELASYGPVKGDPVALALAVTGNNLACTLEEKADRNAEEVALMVLAAETGRRFWEIAGDWKNVERAEYRLSMSQLAAGNAESALDHAQDCLGICAENDAPALELFFAHEALALARQAEGNPVAAQAAQARCAALLDEQDEDMKSYCKAALDQLNARITLS